MRVLCKVSYKGTNYQGWQKQKAAPTVQETIENVLSKILNEETSICGSGRTDAGVHALGQYFHFDLNKDIDLDRLMYSINCLLPQDIHIESIARVNDDFHARFSLKEKQYQYILQIGPRNALHYELETNVPYEIDVHGFIEALKMFKGKHNFQDFNSKEEDENNFIREIYDIDIAYTPSYDHIYVTFTGNGFMRYMIRDMIGVALAVASGKENLTYIEHHLKDNKTREIVPYKAPSEGLYLLDVKY